MSQHPPITSEQRTRLHELKQTRNAARHRWLSDPLNEYAWTRYTAARDAYENARKEYGRE